MMAIRISADASHIQKWVLQDYEKHFYVMLGIVMLTTEMLTLIMLSFDIIMIILSIPKLGAILLSVVILCHNVSLCRVPLS